MALGSRDGGGVAARAGGRGLGIAASPPRTPATPRNPALGLAGAALAAVLLAGAWAGGAGAAADPVLDGFEELSGWTATASPGASVEIAHDAGKDGMAMRLDFDLGAGGWVIARKAFAITLPPNYSFSFDLRAEAPRNNLELKLVEREGGDVWWWIDRDRELSPEWKRVVAKNTRFEFAWGASGGAPLRRTAFLEIAVSAGQGGKGSIWIDNLAFEERPAPPRKPAKPKISASTAVPGQSPEAVLDERQDSGWRSGSVAERQWLQIDFGAKRELGGVVIDWDPDDYAVSYRVELSDDGETWTPVHSVRSRHGGRDYVYLHDAEARFLRLELEQSSRGRGYAIREIGVKPPSFSATPNQFFAAIALDGPAGRFPKYLGGNQSYWTVVGVPGDADEALMNEEGMLELGRGSFSVEPFLFVDGQLVTWHDVRTTQELERGYLPIPSVSWQHDALRLRVTAVAAGEAGSSVLYARYRIENREDKRRDVILFLALRPFQVLPPWQALNMVGGATRVRSLALDGHTVWADGEKPLVSLTPPERFGAAPFDEELIGAYLVRGAVPPSPEASDPFGYASGALQYRASLAPLEHADVVVAHPFQAREGLAALASVDEPERRFERELERAIAAWERDLGRVDLELPPAGAAVARTVKTTLAYIQVNRSGPAIQPGPRNYARSWIRDGAFTSSALLEFGYREEVREFLRWFAGHQLPDGRIPCCIDRRGADRVPENDSNGAFVFAVAEYYRYTRDVGLLWELWPSVVRAIDFIAAQRAERLGEEYQRGEKLVFRGLLPESISHEGYAGRPVHSYWDDFFALRGLDDAVDLARAVGDDDRAASFATLRDDFRADLNDSIPRAMAKHGIDFIPGSVELGDFDATSTAVAVTLGGDLARLPQPALDRTFELYLDHVKQRAKRSNSGEGYTPYELRNVEALIRMGRRETAYQLLELFLADRRPAAWNQWAEVVWRDPTEPRFVGDMPHTWVGSSFLRAVRTMLAFERASNGSLVLGAGLPASWVLAGPGVGVERLPTHHGVLHYRLRPEGRNTLRWTITGDLRVPHGGIVLRPPLPAPLSAVRVNGQPIDEFSADSATVREVPADVLLEWAPSPESGGG